MISFLMLICALFIICFSFQTILYEMKYKIKADKDFDDISNTFIVDD